MRRALCPYMQYNVIVRTVMYCLLYAAIGVCACARTCCFVSCMYDARKCGMIGAAQHSFIPMQALYARSITYYVIIMQNPMQ